MTDTTDTDIANQIQSYLVTIGAQWADLEAGVHAAHSPAADAALKKFGAQLKEFLDSSVRLAAQRLAAKGEISEAINEVLEAEKDFREGMGPEWEGDPLTDVCDRLRAALETAQKGETP